MWVCTIPLRVSSVEDKRLRSRFEVARQVYNASLAEAIRRLGAARASQSYARAVVLRAAAVERTPSGGDGPPAGSVQLGNRRQVGGPWTAHYRAAYQQTGFSDYGLGTYALRLRAPRCGCQRARAIPPVVCPTCGFISIRTWIGDHLGAFSVQRLGVRAFRTAHRLALGTAAGVRFLRRGGITGVDGGSACKEISFDRERSVVVWTVAAQPDLILRALVDSQDDLVRHALRAPVRSVRVIRRRIGGRDRWFAQLTVKGQPLVKEKHPLGSGTAGVSVGVHGVGIVHERGAQLAEFCGELASQERKIRVLQRRMDRQRRANTPENFLLDGRVKGRAALVPWRDSNRYRATLDEYRELERRRAETRRTLQGALLNEVRARANEVSVQVPDVRRRRTPEGVATQGRGAGLFVVGLERKLAPPQGRVSRITGGSLQDMCHACGVTVTTAPDDLRQRWAERVRRCACGVVMQSDLYHAFLAWCSPSGHLDRTLATERWPATRIVMLAAWAQVAGEQTVARLGTSGATG